MAGVFQPNAFQNDAFQIESGGVTSDSFNADAVLLGTQDYAFTADSEISGLVTSANFAADAYLVNVISGTFTANAVIRKTDIAGSFTANAFFDADTPVLESFIVDAWLVKRITQTLTANAFLVSEVTAEFTADAWLRGSEARSFVAHAWLHRDPAPIDITTFHKSITISISQRRPTPLSAYVPPRNTEGESETGDKGPWHSNDPDCLPPCPAYGAGPGGLYGANGAVIRRTIVYCSECGVWYYTDSNKLGIGEGTTSGHAGCAASHSRSLHESRIFADYSAIPELTVSMRAKLLWDINAPNTAVVKVYANSYLPPSMSEVGDFQTYNSTWDNDYWSNGNYVGSLTFTSTNSSSTEGVRWCNITSSLTIVPDSLSTDVFRFEMGDLSQYYGAEFRAPNVPVTVD